VSAARQTPTSLEESPPYSRQGKNLKLYQYLSLYVYQIMEVGEGEGFSDERLFLCMCENGAI
jgi:hypothetical protein